MPQYIFDDQSVEIVCKHCRTTSPKTIAWMQANESYRCAGCNAEIIIDREKLLTPHPPGFDDDGLELKASEGEMTDDDPNDAYEVVPHEPGEHGPPEGWWTVKRNGIPVKHFPGKEKAQRFATDPEYRASLAAGKAWEKAKGK